ncbi:MAG: type II toxin-antitoxin system VapC family toxin [Verrucomicrobiales bacterium]
MIIPDISLLIYAHNDQAPGHERARIWWEGLLNGRVPVGLPWVCLSGFIRLMTHPRVLERPMSVEQAVGHVRSWLECGCVRLLHPGTKFESLYLDSLLTLGAAGNLTTDAQLAALAMEHQAELHSADSDFHRFAGLRWRNPLI